MKRRTLGCILALLLLGGLTACSIALPTPTSSPTGSAPDEPLSSADPAGAPSSDQPTSTAGPAQPDASELGPVVASRSSSDNGKTIHLDLYRVVRDDRLAHVTFTVRSSDEFQVGNLFSAGLESRLENVVDAADGVTLVDAAHARLYLVASEGKSRCVCSTDLYGMILDDDRPAVISASFAAPPRDVTQMEVQIPHFGVFTNVPVV